MISNIQARETYGFADASEREDNIILQVLKIAEALFKSQLLRIVDYSTPIPIMLVAFAFLYGGIRNGINWMLLFIGLSIFFAMTPPFFKKWGIRSVNSGMCHIEKDQGTHFLIGVGICNEKIKEKNRRASRTEYRVIAKMLKGDKIEAITTNEMFEHIKKGGKVTLVIADSENAKQIYAMPPGFIANAIKSADKDIRLYQKVDSSTVRILTEAERAMYINQCHSQFRLWKKLYMRNYLITGLLAAVCSVASIFFKTYPAFAIMMTLLFSMIVITLLQLRDYSKRISFLEKTEELQAVDAVAAREASFDPSLDHKKKSPNAILLFKDKTGAIITTSKKSEDLYIFAPKDKVVLIRQKEDLIPFKANTENVE